MQRRNFLKIMGTSAVGACMPMSVITPDKETGSISISHSSSSSTSSSESLGRPTARPYYRKVTLVEHNPNGPDNHITTTILLPVCLGDIITAGYGNPGFPQGEDGWSTIRHYRVVSICEFPQIVVEPTYYVNSD